MRWRDRGAVAPGRNPKHTRLFQIMTRNPDMIEAEGYTIDALNRRSERGYRHQPVLDDGRLVGILSPRDFLGEEFIPVEKEYSHEQRI